MGENLEGEYRLVPEAQRGGVQVDEPKEGEFHGSFGERGRPKRVCVGDVWVGGLGVGSWSRVRKREGDERGLTQTRKVQDHARQPQDTR